MTTCPTTVLNPSKLRVRRLIFFSKKVRMCCLVWVTKRGSQVPRKQSAFGRQRTNAEFGKRTNEMKKTDSTRVNGKACTANNCIKAKTISFAWSWLHECVYCDILPPDFLAAKQRRILRPNTFKNRKSALRSRILFESKDLDATLLYISTLQTYSKFVRKNNMLALGVCLPQPCPSTGRRFAASRSRLNYY